MNNKIISDSVLLHMNKLSSFIFQETQRVLDSHIILGSSYSFADLENGNELRLSSKAVWRIIVACTGAHVRVFFVTITICNVFYCYSTRIALILSDT